MKRQTWALTRAVLLLLVIAGIFATFGCEEPTLSGAGLSSSDADEGRLLESRPGMPYA